MSLLGKFFLYIRTIKRLRFGQLVHQLLYKLGTWKIYLIPKIIPQPVFSLGLLMHQTDLDPDYLKRFDLQALAAGSISLLHQVYPFPWSLWRCSEASALFQFNLHYHEYLIPLAASYQQKGRPEDLQLVLRIIDDWIDTCCRLPDKCGKHKLPQCWYDAWAPYTISLRAINWLVCMEILGDNLPDYLKDKMNKVLYVQFLHLRRNLEKRVLANHYLENLKTLYILSLYFGDTQIQAFSQKKLTEQLCEQVLSSGLHIERSLMYHRILLEGLMRCLLAAKAAGVMPPDTLRETVTRMLSYSAWVEQGWQRTPLFNDAGDNVAKSLSSLLNAADFLGILPTEYVQQDEPDYHVLHIPQTAAKLIIDADVMGPRYMLGHGHCDCLSFELAINGTPLFVNAGTYQYQGSLRQYFRSTSAHNTAMIDNVQQAQTWGEHRVAGSFGDVRVKRSTNSLTGVYKTWQGIRHERTFSIQGPELTVSDSFYPCYGVISSFLRLAPEARLFRQEDGSYLVIFQGRSVCTIHALIEAPTLLENSQLNCYSPEFGLLTEAHTLMFKWDGTRGLGGYRVVFMDT